MQNLFSIKVVE